MARQALWLRPYMPGDIDRFVPRPDLARELAASSWDWADGPPPRTWTLVQADASGAVRGVGGVMDVGDDAWIAWAVLADLSAREFCLARPLAEEVLAGVERFVRPPRIFATAREASPGAVQLLRKLGFRVRRRVIDERVGEDVVYQLMTREAA